MPERAAAAALQLKVCRGMKAAESDGQHARERRPPPDLLLMARVDCADVHGLDGRVRGQRLIRVVGGGDPCVAWRKDRAER